MVAPEPITSRSNALLKRVRAVRTGREEGLGLLEGRRLIEDAVGAGVELELLLAEADQELPPALADQPGLRPVAAGLLAGLGELKTSPGVLALARLPALRPLAELAVEPDTLLLALAGVADPGNVGACVRAAEAAGASAVALGPRTAGPFSGRALRGSMGSAFRVPLFRFDASAELAGLGLHVARAATRGAEDYRRAPLERPLCLWIPGETGAASLEPPAGTAGVTIPMAGRVESLNVATAATLLLFEAARRGE